MKPIAILICLLVLCLLAGCGTEPAAAPETSAAPAATAARSDAAWDELAGKGSVGTVLPDFTVATVDGGSVSLSGLLAERELVLINLWATWCPPCRGEFPDLEAAYERCRDRVEVLALSVEESDSPEILKRFAEEYGLSFPVGRDEELRFTRSFRVTGIPTSLLVDRSRTVVWMTTGAMPSAEAILELFDSHLEGGLTDEDKPLYTVFVQDAAGAPVAGAVVGFCNDETCNTFVTDENGAAVFRGARFAYHIQLLSLPDGWDYSGSDALQLPAQGGEMRIVVTRAGE